MNEEEESLSNILKLDLETKQWINLTVSMKVGRSDHMISVLDALMVHNLCK